MLVGAGHAHAIVLERWAKGSRPEADLVVVTDREASLYSGMIPGWVAGEYERSDLELDARLMAERAGARLVIGQVVAIEADEQLLTLTDGSRISYDILSLDVGSDVAGPTGEAKQTHVSAREPEAIVAGLSAVRGATVIVVGGGAAGVELAACAGAFGGGHVTLVEAGPRLMAGHDASVSSRVQSELEARSVSVRLGAKVEVGSDPPPGDLTIWATGAKGPGLLADSGLPVDEQGFVIVDPQLRVIDADDLFAAGDCASIEAGAPAKAGFHAIQQGDVLADNLAMTVESWPRQSAQLRSYRPKADFLTLLNLGDGRALGTKWGFTVEGRWVRRLKDLIDRRFVRRFQSRRPTAAPTT